MQTVLYSFILCSWLVNEVRIGITRTKKNERERDRFLEEKKKKKKNLYIVLERSFNIL